MPECEVDMYTDTITLFNRYHSKTGDVWYKHIIHNVDLIVDRASLMAKYGAETTDRAKLHIRFSNAGNEAYIGSNKYIASKEWNKLGETARKASITFNSDANYFDFFILGEYSGSDVINDSTYLDGFFAQMEKTTECYALSSVGKYGLIPHFEITAR